MAYQRSTWQDCKTSYDVCIGRPQREQVGAINICVHRDGVIVSFYTALELYPPKSGNDERRVYFSTGKVICAIERRWPDREKPAPKWFLLAVEKELNIYFAKELKRVKRLEKKND